MVKKSVFLFLIIFLSLFVYIYTLLPTTDFGDIGELQAASCTLGIVHPPGYPTYVILGKLFTFLPFASPAWRVNFMSAFFSTGSLILFFIISSKIYKSEIIAFLTTLILAFSQNFWFFSLVAEMYSLNVFFMMLFLFFILFSLKGRVKKDLKKYCLFFFLLGLAQGNHRNITLITPLLVLYLFGKKPKIFLNFRRALKMLIFFLLGLGIYFFIPLRASQNPYLNYNRPNNWQNFKYLAMAQQFRFLMFTVPLKKIFTERIAIFYQLLNEQFFILGLILAVLGLGWLLYKRQYRLIYLLAGIFLVNTFVWLAYNTDDIYRYLTPSFVMVAFFIAGGIKVFYSLVNSLINKAKLKKLNNSLKLMIYLFLLFFIGFLLKTNYQEVDQSQEYGAYNWGINYMGKLKKDAVVISYWPYSAVMWYLQGCEKIRPDIFIADDRVIQDEGWQTLLNTAKHFIGNRPVYIIPWADRLDQIKAGGFEVRKQKEIYEVIGR